MSIEEEKAKIQGDIESSKLSEKEKIELLSIVELIYRNSQFRTDINPTDKRFAEKVAVINYDRNPRLAIVKRFIGDDESGERQEAVEEMSLEDLAKYVKGRIPTAELYMCARSIMNAKAAGIIKKQIEESQLDEQQKSDLIAALEEASRDPLGRIDVGIANDTTVNKLQIVPGDDIFGESSRKSRLAIVHRFVDPATNTPQELADDDKSFEELVGFVRRRNQRIASGDERE